MAEVLHRIPVSSLLFLVGLAALRAVGEAPNSPWVHPSIAGGVLFTVEWSDMLTPNSWSANGVTQFIRTDDRILQPVKANAPKSTPHAPII